MQSGEEQSAWFDRHGSTPITDIPAHWPKDYQTLVAHRAADFPDGNLNIALIEPRIQETMEPGGVGRSGRCGLKLWLLDRLESGRYWPDLAHFAARTDQLPALAKRAAQDSDFLQAAALYTDRPDFPLPRLVEELVSSESVPFLPVLRYKPSGLTKRRVWERTWDLQRREDAGEDVGPIPVPPKYDAADFHLVA